MKIVRRQTSCVFALSALLVMATLLQPLRGELWTQQGDHTCAHEDDCTFTQGEGLGHDLEWGAGRQRYFFADVLLWTVREGAAENWAQNIVSGGNQVGNATLIGAPFDWTAGFRVGTGVHREGGFDTTLYYTNFHTSARNQASGEIYSALLGNFFMDNTDGGSFGPHYLHASVLWDFNFHSIDFEFGRSHKVGTNLELRPFLGLKAAIIKQSIKTRWLGPIDTPDHTYTFTSATEDLNLDFWGIGPSLGVTIAMPLRERESSSLKLFGTPSAAIMFGRWNCREVYENDEAQIAVDTSPITGAATMLRGVIGLEWERRSTRMTSTVRFGYEAQVWLNQMQFYSYNMGRLNNLMSLQGGFMELCVGF